MDKEIKEIEEFVKRRDAMLEKRSVEELSRFIATDKAYDGDPVRENFARASQEVKKLTLLKMILWSTNVSDATVGWAFKEYQKYKDESIEDAEEEKEESEGQ